MARKRVGYRAEITRYGAISHVGSFRHTEDEAETDLIGLLDLVKTKEDASDQINDIPLWARGGLYRATTGAVLKHDLRPDDTYDSGNPSR